MIQVPTYKTSEKTYTYERSWHNIRRKSQCLPKGNWKTWLILAGRGFGKSRTAAENITDLILEDKIKRIAIISDTMQQVQDIMVPKIMDALPKEAIFKISKNKIFYKDVIIYLFSSHKREAIRGYEFDFVWIDEFATCNNKEKLWEQVGFCTRIGQSRIIITTTPIESAILKEIAQSKDTYLTSGSSFDNKKNMSKNFLQNANKKKNTIVGKVEIYGQFLDNTLLWVKEDIRYKTPTEPIIEYSLGIDPAVGGGTTGIILVGYTKNRKKAYILEDYSTHYGPNIWMRAIKEITDKYSNIQIQLEINQGGDLLENSLRNYGVNCYIQKHFAANSKTSRNIPTFCAYKTKEIYHAKPLLDLEEEMLYTQKDRTDALTWALYSFYNNKELKFIGLI